MLAISIIIPTLNAASALAKTLGCCNGVAETIVVDGGSSDATLAIAAQSGCRIESASAGRGSQLRHGATIAGQPWLLFLHADTVLADGWQGVVAKFIDAPESPRRAAYFTFALDDTSPGARRLMRLVRWRNHAFALPYGDQGLLVHRDLYEWAGGFAPIPIMEDVDLIRRLGRERLVKLDIAAITSAAKWREQGWWRRSLRNLYCLTLFFLGVSPERIRTIYR